MHTITPPPTLTAIDLFTGMGGWNLALSSLGIPVLLAANHNKESLRTNALNFTNTRHVCVDILTGATDFLPDVDIATSSPECRYQSTGAGVQLLHQGQLRGSWTDGSDDPSIAPSRETMNGVHRWAEVKAEQEKQGTGKRIKIIFVENVPDLFHWIGLASWYQKMEKLGYRHTTISFNSMFARPTPLTVPQSRDRTYIVLWLDHLPAPDMTIRPSAFCPRCHQEVAAIQCWNGQDTRFGEYGPQYDYRCPSCTKPIVPFYTPVETILDWSLPMTRIGQRTHPLCENTLRKIQRGLHWYVRRHPSAASFPGRKAFLMSYYRNPVFRDIGNVAGTVPTRDRHCLITLPDQWIGPTPEVQECGYRMCTKYQAMMGVPPDFRFVCSKTKALQQLGLAVTPAAAVEVLRRGLTSLGYSVQGGNQG